MSCQIISERPALGHSESLHFTERLPSVRQGRQALTMLCAQQEDYPHTEQLPAEVLRLPPGFLLSAQVPPQHEADPSLS